MWSTNFTCCIYHARSCSKGRCILSQFRSQSSESFLSEMASASSASESSGVTTQASSHQPKIQPRALQETTDSGSDHNSSSDGDDAAESSSIPIFEPTDCLFCRSISDSIDTNLDHMSKSHGMIIPSPHQLTVDPTTLLSYLNLVVSVYNECLTCGTQRRNTQAIQQHMLGKKHCAFDISNVESEYREFWSFGEDEAGVQIDGENITLPSGRVVMSRSVRTTQQRQRPSGSGMNALTRLNASSLEASISSPSDFSNLSANTSSTSHKQALSKQDVRALDLDKQLGTLRTSDRLALAHLSASEQRAILATQHSQLQKARRQERDMQARLQRKNNQTLMKHFVPDVPGPKLG
jgi:pre-60S factor REI1